MFEKEVFWTGQAVSTEIGEQMPFLARPGPLPPTLPLQIQALGAPVPVNGAKLATPPPFLEHCILGMAPSAPRKLTSVSTLVIIT